MTTLMYLLIFAIICVILLFGYYYVDNYHARMLCQENEYEQKYRWIQNRIDTEKRSIENYKSIERALICLAHLPWRNKEKTIKLSENFWEKWTEQRIQIRDERMDEFSPEEVFGNN